MSTKPVSARLNRRCRPHVADSTDGGRARGIGPGAHHMPLEDVLSAVEVGATRRLIATSSRMLRSTGVTPNGSGKLDLPPARAPMRNERIDQQNSHTDVHQRPDRVVRNPPDGADSKDRSGEDPNPAGGLRAAKHEGGRNEQDCRHHDIYPAICLEAVPEDRVLEIFRHRTVIAESPDRVEDPHDSRDEQHQGSKCQPRVILPVVHWRPLCPIRRFSLRSTRAEIIGEFDLTDGGTAMRSRLAGGVATAPTFSAMMWDGSSPRARSPRSQ